MRGCLGVDSSIPCSSSESLEKVGWCELGHERINVHSLTLVSHRPGRRASCIQWFSQLNGWCTSVWFSHIGWPLENSWLRWKTEWTLWWQLVSVAVTTRYDVECRHISGLSHNLVATLVNQCYMARCHWWPSSFFWRQSMAASKSPSLHIVAQSDTFFSACEVWIKDQTADISTNA